MQTVLYTGFILTSEKNPFELEIKNLVVVFYLGVKSVMFRCSRQSETLRGTAGKEREGLWCYVIAQSGSDCT